jgi:N-acetylneuraminic acid mutarotase
MPDAASREDGSVDSSVPDSGIDGADDADVRDSGTEAAIDSTVDGDVGSGTDATTDAALDASVADSGPDATLDAASDAGVADSSGDATLEASVIDAGTDAMVDASVVDSDVDATIDASDDVAPTGDGADAASEAGGQGAADAAPDAPPECIIGGTTYASGQTNPARGGCQSCQPATSTTSWMNADDGTSCDSQRMCIAGACVPDWTWVGGANSTGQRGTYGSTPSPSNMPGARYGTVGWKDPSGQAWVFGGLGVDGSGHESELNDLWRYSAGEWTWMSGSSTVNQPGSYGTRGIASASNVPGGRNRPTSMVDSSGNLWLFGGVGLDSTGSVGNLSDFWEYSAGEWTWMSGPKVADQPGVYGTRNTPAIGNNPGARFSAVGGADHAGHFWLFGGYVVDSTGTNGRFSDLWMYEAGEWTWVSGPTVADQNGVYGSLNTPSAANAPGARTDACSWMDTSGNLWVFGGEGFDSAGAFGYLNDLWEFSAGQWTWVSGSNSAKQPGVYGTVGTAAPTNVPGARFEAMCAIDSTGALWLFGGEGYDAAGNPRLLDDLWRYSAGEWTWMSGADTGDVRSITTTLGGAGIPGSRELGVFWIDSSLNPWVFGGWGVDVSGNAEALNDLWTR